MSSIIAHSLTALTIGKLKEKPFEPKIYQAGWYLWLVMIAVLPDLDYVIPFLSSTAHGGLRITHSVLAVLFLPTFTISILALFRLREGTLPLAFLSIQLLLAGISHLVLDILVGSSHLPLFWPFSPRIYKLPFGYLPNIGGYYFTDPRFYLNLALEMGIFVPLYILFHRFKGNQKFSKGQILLNWGLGFVGGICLFWAYRLPR